MLWINILVPSCSDMAVEEISMEGGSTVTLLLCLCLVIPTACSWQAAASAALLGLWDLDALLWRG
jgi:hypothetical protein